MAPKMDSERSPGVMSFSEGLRGDRRVRLPLRLRSSHVAGEDVRRCLSRNARNSYSKSRGTFLLRAIRYSETFNVPVRQLIRAEKGHRLKGIIAKRAGSQYHSGERSADWLKWRANRGQEFVIGGYNSNGNALDSILVGYYNGHDLTYAASIRAGISAELRRAVLPHFEKLRIPRCPFSNLPDRTEGL